MKEQEELLSIFIESLEPSEEIKVPKGNSDVSHFLFVKAVEQAKGFGFLQGKKKILDHLLKSLDSCPKCMRPALREWILSQSFDVEHDLEHKIYKDG